MEAFANNYTSTNEVSAMSSNLSIFKIESWNIMWNPGQNNFNWVRNTHCCQTPRLQWDSFRKFYTFGKSRWTQLCIQWVDAWWILLLKNLKIQKSKIEKLQEIKRMPSLPARPGQLILCAGSPSKPARLLLCKLIYRIFEIYIILLKINGKNSNT